MIKNLIYIILFSCGCFCSNYCMASESLSLTRVRTESTSPLARIMLDNTVHGRLPSQMLLQSMSMSSFDLELIRIISVILQSSNIGAAIEQIVPIMKESETPNLQSGVREGLQTQFGQTSLESHLLECIERGDSTGVQNALLVGADPNTIDRQGMTALMAAIRSRQTILVQYLVDAGARVQKVVVKSIDGAAQGDRITALDIAMQTSPSDSDKNYVSGNDAIYNIIYSAADAAAQKRGSKKRNPAKLAKLLREVKPVAGAETTGFSRIYEAAKNGDVNQLRSSCDIYSKIELSLFVNASDANGMTPLAWAAGRGHVECVRELLARGATVDNTGSGKARRTPLHWAAETGRAVTTALLLRHGAQVDALEYGSTPLMLALDSCISAQAEKQTFKKESERIEEDPKSLSSVIDILIKNGANLTLTTRSGSTYLHMAVEKDLAEMVQLLLRQHADVNQADFKGNTPLMVAARFARPVIMGILLREPNVQVNAANIFGETALMQACIKDDKTDTGAVSQEKCIAQLLEAGADLRLRDKKGQTAFEWALQLKRTTAVNNFEQCIKLKYLTEELIGAIRQAIAAAQTNVGLAIKSVIKLINPTDNFQRHIAKRFIEDQFGKGCIDHYFWQLMMANPSVSDLEPVLQFGVRVNEAKSGKLPLVEALEKGRNDVARCLLSYGADINAVSGAERITALMYVASTGNIEMLREILNVHTPELEIRNKRGSTALAMAIEAGQAASVLELCQASASTAQVNQLGQSAKHLAHAKRNSEILRILENDRIEKSTYGKFLECLSRKSLKDALPGIAVLLRSEPEHKEWVRKKVMDRYNGADCLEKFLLASLHERNSEAINDVLALDPSLECTNEYGSTPLIIATQNRLENVALRFIERKVNVNRSDFTGRTALLQASVLGLVNVVDALLKAGADPNSASKTKDTPLMLAAHNGHEGVIELLLTGGADPNRQNNSGTTALHWAALNDQVEVVRKLLSRGAQPHLLTKNKTDALMLASQQGHVNVVDVLLAHGVAADKENSDKESALSLAIGLQRVAVVETLLKARGGAYIKGGKQRALQLSKNNIELLELLTNAVTLAGDRLHSYLSDLAQSANTAIAATSSSRYERANGSGSGVIIPGKRAIARAATIEHEGSQAFAPISSSDVRQAAAKTSTPTRNAVSAAVVAAAAATTAIDLENPLYSPSMHQVSQLGRPNGSPRTDSPALSLARPPVSPRTDSPVSQLTRPHGSHRADIPAISKSLPAPSEAALTSSDPLVTGAWMAALSPRGQSGDNIEPRSPRLTLRSHRGSDQSQSYAASSEVPAQLQRPSPREAEQVALVAQLQPPSPRAAASPAASSPAQQLPLAVSSPVSPRQTRRAAAQTEGSSWITCRGSDGSRLNQSAGSSKEVVMGEKSPRRLRREDSESVQDADSSPR